MLLDIYLIGQISGLIPIFNIIKTYDVGAGDRVKLKGRIFITLVISFLWPFVFTEIVVRSFKK